MPSTSTAQGAISLWKSWAWSCKRHTLRYLEQAILRHEPALSPPCPRGCLRHPAHAQACHRALRRSRPERAARPRGARPAARAVLGYCARGARAARGHSREPPWWRCPCLLRGSLLAHEDDALRAVRAATEFRAAARCARWPPRASDRDQHWAGLGRRRRLTRSCRGRRRRQCQAARGSGLGRRGLARCQHRASPPRRHQDGVTRT